MDKLTAIKIKYDDGTYSDEIPVSVLSENVEWDSTHTLVDVLGGIDVDVTGTVQDQISQLFNSKVSNTQLQTYVNNQLNIDVTNWLNTNVNPVGSAVVVDKTLSIEGAAADAKVVGNLKSDLNIVADGLDDETARAQAEEARIEALFTQPVEDAVSDWLNDHPEATTTVQDGSLTESKLSNALKLKTIKDYVTPEMFGANADGVQDDTNAILDAYDYAVENGKELHFNAKTYVLSEPIEIRTYNVRISGEYPRTKIMYTGTGNLFDIYVYDANNDNTFEISGLVIRTETGENGFYINYKMFGLIKDIDIKGFKKNFYLHGDHAIHYLSFVNIYSNSLRGKAYGYGLYFYSENYAGANSCYFTNCRFSGYDGALYMRGASVSDPINNISFVNCCFEQDHDYVGDAVDCDYCTKIAFIGCRFEGAVTHKVKAIGYNYFIACAFYTLEQDISASAVILSGKSNINRFNNLYLSQSPLKVTSHLSTNSELINTVGTGGAYISEKCNGDIEYYGGSGNLLFKEIMTYDTNKWAKKIDGRLTCTEFRAPIVETFSALQQYPDKTDGITVLFLPLNCIICYTNSRWYKLDGTIAIVSNENINTYYPYPSAGMIVLNTSLSTSKPTIYTGSAWQVMN